MHIWVLIQTERSGYIAHRLSLNQYSKIFLLSDITIFIYSFLEGDFYVTNDYFNTLALVLIVIPYISYHKRYSDCIYKEELLNHFQQTQCNRFATVFRKNILYRYWKSVSADCECKNQPAPSCRRPALITDSCFLTALACLWPVTIKALRSSYVTQCSLLFKFSALNLSLLFYLRFLKLLSYTYTHALAYWPCSPE